MNTHNLDWPSVQETQELTHIENLLDQRWPETKIDPTLDRVNHLMDLLGQPQRAYPSIHIAGTNGKTSVARMIDALLVAFHRRTGRTISPHLQTVTERISIDGHPLDPQRYIQAYHDIEPFVHMVDQASQAAGGPTMSKFEVLTSMAFAAFADTPIDVGIIETGMGGLWDATNVIAAPVAVLTPISVDHTDYLGHDLVSIATEKAGIICPSPTGDVDTVAVIADQPPSVMCAIVEHACHIGAVVARQNSEFHLIKRTEAVRGQLLDIQGLGGIYSDIFLPLYGEHQAHNATLALAAVEAFFGAGKKRQLDIDTVRAGFALATSPGRLEQLRGSPPIFIDAAHNPAGATALAQTLSQDLPFDYLIGIVSILGDKDAAGILNALEPVCDQIIITHNGSPRALDIPILTEIATQQFGPDRVLSAYILPDALDRAIELADQFTNDHCRAGIIITGSVATAGAARTLLKYIPQ